MMYTATGELVPSQADRQLMRNTARGLSASNAARHAQAAKDNVQRMLSTFEAGRLAAGGAFDADEALVGGDGWDATGGGGAPGGGGGARTLEVLSNEDAYRRDKRQSFAPSRAVSVRLGKQDELVLPPPNVTEARWLVDCVRLFRESLDLSLSAKLPDPQPYMEKLKSIVVRHTQFIDDQAVGLSLIHI